MSVFNISYMAALVVFLLYPLLLTIQNQNLNVSKATSLTDWLQSTVTKYFFL